MSNSKKRVITAIVMGLVIIPFLFFGGYFFYGLLALGAYVATYELIKMHNEKYELPGLLNFLVPLFSMCLVILTMIIDMADFSKAIRLILYALVILIVFLLIISLIYKELKVTDSFYYIGSILYGGLSFALMGVIRNSYIEGGTIFKVGSIDIRLIGLAVFGFVLLTNMCTDIFAYEVGKRIGKHKLIPDVSPNKTIEGSIGGSLFGSIFGTVELILTSYFFNFNLFGISNYFLYGLAAFGVALTLTIISQFGDLIASKLKREYDIKDYGNCFPGHGGVMDRFDSLILTSAVFFIVLVAFGVIG